MRFIKLTVADRDINLGLGSDRELIIPRHEVIIPVDNIIAVEECTSVNGCDIEDKGITEVYVKNGECVDDYIVEESIGEIYERLTFDY
ncbi:hypothetical protein QSV38_02275 [Streptococcus parasuis]|uniref:hypothetical protein n=1 Tax=Streptococcus parasuis TaxID=1501662 RepID=UPI0025A5C234|nr:hypothetical protein [Streptococcus parasuis]WJQ86109.1 hypothetical protein QSV38_02275 [Streptococcus parasuis]